MLRSVKQMYGESVSASDGEIGNVKDFLFDEQNWAVRYVAVDTGSWLPGRQVLISPHALGRPDSVDKVLHVDLTRKQIENGPPLASHQPVSRQYEDKYHCHFGWPSFWAGGAAGALNASQVSEKPSESPPSAVPQNSYADAHLRSSLAVKGYQLGAKEGILGHVCDFIIDDQTWAISRLVVKIGHRFTGKEVLIPVQDVNRISYPDSTVFVNLTSAAVEQSPAHDLSPVLTPH